MGLKDQIVEWVRTGVQGPAKPNREMVAQYIEQLHGALATAYAEHEKTQARIAELERQAEIGRRAVKMLEDLEWSGGPSGWPACPCCGWDIGPNGHAEGCKLSAILRDAEQAGMGAEQ